MDVASATPIKERNDSIGQLASDVAIKFVWHFFGSELCGAHQTSGIYVSLGSLVPHS